MEDYGFFPCLSLSKPHIFVSISGYKKFGSVENHFSKDFESVMSFSSSSRYSSCLCECRPFAYKLFSLNLFFVPLLWKFSVTHPLSRSGDFLELLLYFSLSLYSGQIIETSVIF